MSRLRNRRLPWNNLRKQKELIKTAHTDIEPDKYEGLIGWYRADWSQVSGGDSAVVNDPVATLVDHSGKGNDLTQGTEANMPTLAFDVLQGSQYLNFDGSNDNMMSNAMIAGKPVHIFLVIEPNHLSPVGGRIFSDAGANNMDLAINGSTLIMRDSASTIVKPEVAEEVILVECCFDGTESYICVNGDTPVRGNLALSALNGLEVGSIGGGFYALFHFFEMLVYTRRLKGTQRTNIRNYMMNLYHIT